MGFLLYILSVTLFPLLLHIFFNVVCSFFFSFVRLPPSLPRSISHSLSLSSLLFSHSLIPSLQSRRKLKCCRDHGAFTTLEITMSRAAEKSVRGRKPGRRQTVLFLNCFPMSLIDQKGRHKQSHLLLRCNEITKQLAVHL